MIDPLDVEEYASAPAKKDDEYRELIPDIDPEFSAPNRGNEEMQVPRQRRE